MNSLIKYIIFIFISLTVIVRAETVFISQDFNVGLHEDKTSNSPIITLVRSGSELEIIKREDSFTYVASSSGARGWIDNSYLSNDSTGPSGTGTGTQELLLQLEAAKLEIDQLKTNSESSSELLELRSEHRTLQQAFNAEQIKAGELQVQLAELRKRIGQDNDNAALYAEIEGLQQDKKTLEIQLAAMLEQGGFTDISGTDTNSSQASNWRNLLIYFSIAVFIGFCAGIYLMDLINRKRHAGLRI